RGAGQCGRPLPVASPARLSAAEPAARRSPRSQAGQPEMAQATEVEAGSCTAELALGELLGHAQRLVDRREDHVGEDLDILRVDGRRVDLDLAQLQVAADLDGDHAAARRSLDDLV